MDFLLHWSIGFILGTLITLPFITGRWIYDYDNHKWIPVRWGPVVDPGTARRYGIKGAEIATPELYPITSSRFVIYHLILANACGIIALVPDFPQIFGVNGGDHGLLADMFFFHSSIDSLSASTSATILPFAFIAAILVWVIVISIALGAQNDSTVKESVGY